MHTSIFILWFLVLIITSSLTAINLNNPIRMIVPVIGLLGVCGIEHLSQIKFEKKVAVFVRRILAVPFLVLGFNWISIFTLTTYRIHHRPIIIPLAIVFLIIGLALTHYKISSGGKSASISSIITEEKRDSVIVKLFVIYAIFILSSSGLLLSGVYFMCNPKRFGDLWTDIIVRVSAFVIIVSGLLFFRFIFRRLIKRFKLETGKEISVIQKRLLIFLITLVYGFIVGRVLFYHDFSDIIFFPKNYIVSFIVFASGSFTNAILAMLKELNPVIDLSKFSIMAIHMTVYCILGLILSFIGVRNKKPDMKKLKED